LEFEHVIITGLAEIFRRPVVIDFERQLIVEERTRDAGPDFEIVELAIRIERTRIRVVISGNIDGPLA
jgi:hypothetical protein